MRLLKATGKTSKTAKNTFYLARNRWRRHFTSRAVYVARVKLFGKVPSIFHINFILNRRHFLLLCISPERVLVIVLHELDKI